MITNSTNQPSCSKISIWISLSNNQGKTDVIVEKIGYDKEDHTVYTKLGNGTESNYTYDRQRERLQDMTLTGSGNTLMQNKYQYDAVDNDTTKERATSIIVMSKITLGN